MTCTDSDLTTTKPAPERLKYAGLLVMMLMSLSLVTAEFLPNGLLLEMAQTLNITPGQAGQTVTVTALVGLLVAPTIGIAIPRLDRRTLLIWMAVAGGVSNLLVAIAPNFVLLLLARFLLGAALSGFWAMSITVAARMAGTQNLGRAMMFVSAGASLATVLGVPLGVLFSGIASWQVVFAVAGIFTALLGIALRAAVPSVPAAPTSSLGYLWDTLKLPGIAIGLAGHVGIVFGHMVAYTYIRVALLRVPDIATETVVLVLSLFGVGGVFGTFVIGNVIDKRFLRIVVTAPLLSAAAVITVIAVPGPVAVTAIAVTVWGFFFASWLIVVNAWLGRSMPDRLEAGGGLVVSGFQLGIVLAAATGGVLVDAFGVPANYGASAAALLLGGLLFGSSAVRAVRSSRPPEPSPATATAPLPYAGETRG